MMRRNSVSQIKYRKMVYAKGGRILNEQDFARTYGFTTEDLDELLENKKYREFLNRINSMEEPDIAEYMENLSDERMLLVFRMLHKDTAAEVFSFLPVEMQQTIINDITDANLGDIMDDLHTDDVVDMLEELPATVVRRVLENVKPERRKIINLYLQYPEDSAGSIMTSEYLALRRGMTVEEALSYIHYNIDRSEMIYTLYVIDDERHLEGVVSLRDLFRYEFEDLIGDIMETNVIKCTAFDDQEDVADLFNRYDLISVPVVDSEDRMVGIVTVDDAMDVLTSEATEDMEKMAAITPTDRPYFRTSVWETCKSRVPWLLFLMLSATFTSIIINSYELALAACVVLTGFIPMLMDTAGNAGSQSTVTVIRALSLGDIKFNEMFRVIWKELRVSLICGLTLAVVNFVKIYLVDGLLLHNPQITPAVDFCVCLTLLFTVMFAQFIGCVLPMLADKAHMDPAVMASPLITTIVDACSLLIYFNVAAVLLGI